MKLRLFRFYIPVEFTQKYLEKRLAYDNYIMNIAIVGDYFMNNRINNTDDQNGYYFLYSSVFDTPFYPEKYIGLLRLTSEGYRTNNKYLLAIPVAIKYCKFQGGCYDNLLETCDLGILDRLYSLNDGGNVLLKDL
jgi:hypothetical protein